jgi:MarR family transcriptional regulator for hemolysin
MKNDPPTDADAVYHDFIAALAPTRRAWVQAAGIALSHTGLSVPLATAVLLVAREPNGIQQNVLAEAAGVNRATMTRTLDQAVALRLLERRDCAGNRRANRVHVLSEGRKLADAMEGEIATLRGLIFADLPVDALAAANDTLRLVEARLARFVREETGARP